jgi:hypothetical protein
MSLQREKKLCIRENIISTVNGPRNGRKVRNARQILIVEPLGCGCAGTILV